MDLWIVGKWCEAEQWEFMGVFDTPGQAVAACTSPDMFVAPAALNERVPDLRGPWPGLFYPLPAPSAPMALPHGN